MKSRWLQISLVSDVIISAAGAGSGAHRTLSYIPGGNIRGASARILHSKDSTLSADEKWTVFHSGKVRFLPAYPVEEKFRTTAFPTPLSIRRSHKFVPAQFANKLDTRYIYNAACSGPELQVGSRPAGTFVINNDRFYSPATTVALKSSTIARRSDVKGGLFTYEALRAGQTFYCCIQADKEISDDLMQLVIDSLCDVPVRLGRSKQKEFGAVEISEVTLESEVLPVVNEHSQDAIIIYAFSDIALRSAETGQTILTPEASHFGLPPESQYLPNRSWLDTRQYSPFNSYLNAVEKERFVISMGSVMVFSLPAKFDWTEHRNRLQSGVGDYRNEGLGQVVMQPVVLMKYLPDISKSGVITYQKLSAIMPDSPDEFFDWLTQRNKAQNEDIEAARLADTWSQALSLYTGNRAPTPSQWGQIRHLAMSAKSFEELFDYLFAVVEPNSGDEAGLLNRGVSKELWGVIEYDRARKKRVSLRDTLIQFLEREDNKATALRALQLTAARMVNAGIS